MTELPVRGRPILLDLAGIERLLGVGILEDLQRLGDLRRLVAAPPPSSRAGASALAFLPAGLAGVWAETVR